MKFTNNHNVSLPLAVWSVVDAYDYIPVTNGYSVTALLKPLKQLILGSRVTQEQKSVPDVIENVSRALGNTIHDGIEKAWKNTKLRSKALDDLGIDQSIIDAIKVNPSLEEVRANPDIIPIYLEKRTALNITINDGTTFNISGKFDMVLDGQLYDHKSTSAYTWLFGGKDEEYIVQGSLYKYLNPEIITSDTIEIQFVFTDWMKAQAKLDPNYPANRVMAKEYPLMSRSDTEVWLINRLSAIAKYRNLPESEIPECTDAELWRQPPIYKYYSDPDKVETALRSSGTFTSLPEAQAKLREKGKGIIITVLGEPKRCAYCDAFPICEQKNLYIKD